MKIEQWNPEKLVDYARNPRKNDHAVERVAAAIREFGFRVPIIAKSDGLVVDGHLRLKAARKLGLTTVPVVLADDMSDTQIKAFRISVNRMAELAEWDTELLALEMQDLTDAGVGIDVAGFSADELEALIEVAEPEEKETTAHPEEDDLPEMQEKAITRTGDVWLLGKHRVMCGDSAQLDSVKSLICDNGISLVIADPPYFGKVKAEWDNAFDGFEQFLDFLDCVFSIWIPLIIERGTSGWWCAPDFAWHIEERLRNHAAIFNHIVWSKGAGMGAMVCVDDMRRWRPRSERLLLAEKKYASHSMLASFTQKTAHIASRIAYASLIDKMIEWKNKANLSNKEIDRCLGTSGMAGHYFGKSQWELPTKNAWDKLVPLFMSRGVDIGDFETQRREFDAQRREFDAQRNEFDASGLHENKTDVWVMSAPSGEDRHGHPTPKPVALIAKIISAHSRPDDLICDPFLGSGTTLIAAEQLGRKCYGMELSPQYCDVIVKRWQILTGKQAVRESDGITFDQAGQV